MSGACKDLTGMRFGRWVVLKRKGSRTYTQEDGHSTTFPLWLCRCDCGTEAVVMGDNLKRGLSKSCGCLRDELLKERNEKRTRRKENG